MNNKGAEMIFNKEAMELIFDLMKVGKIAYVNEDGGYRVNFFCEDEVLRKIVKLQWGHDNDFDQQLTNLFQNIVSYSVGVANEVVKK